ncbi:MAG: alpha/beta hydrolase [Flavobacteriaceae bacterium]|nr:alpha/beta hydrolase [Flavobacteriaceae bacterium]
METYYKVLGKGDTLVLLHGFLEDHSIWEKVADHLSETYQLLLIDLPAHGKTPITNEICSMQCMAKAVSDVLEKEKIDKATLVGHSLGGYVALSCLQYFPKKFNGICLVNSTTDADSPERLQNRDRAIQAVKQNKNLFIRSAIPGLFNQDCLEKHRNTLDALVSRACLMSSESIISVIKGMKIRPNSEQILADYKGRKLWVIGEKDNLLPLKNVKKIAKKTNTPFLVLPDGHMSPVENSKELAYAICAFFP